MTAALVMALATAPTAQGVRQTMSQIKSEKVGPASNYDKETRPNLWAAEQQGLNSGVNGSCPEAPADRVYSQVRVWTHAARKFCPLLLTVLVAALICTLCSSTSIISPSTRNLSTTHSRAFSASSGTTRVWRTTHLKGPASRRCYFRTPSRSGSQTCTSKRPQASR